MGFWHKLWSKSRAPTKMRLSLPGSDKADGNKAGAKLPTPPGLGLNKERIGHMFERPSSFSFLLFEGDMVPHIPSLLETCGYRILRIGKVSGEFLQVYSGANQLGPDKSVVLKAAYQTGWHTVLIEPEMVFAALFEKQLLEFCKARATNAMVVTWERVSETVMLAEFKAEGKTRSTWFCQGREEEKLSPHMAIVESPDSTGLLKAISEYINPEEIFGNISATAYEMRFASGQSE